MSTNRKLRVDAKVCKDAVQSSLKSKSIVKTEDKGERTIPYSWRACKQLRHLCETALRSNGLFASMFDGLVAFAVDRWRHDCGARRVRFISRPGSPMSEGRFVLGTFRSGRYVST
ncbi:hypothetical protein TNCV_3084561 [Trichonephila clavipes]|nr:hypothetical protein TNCV_3084561 [Trichonephila clavipes]